jgi:deoxyadenosine/deoxycytidine kinase
VSIICLEGASGVGKSTTALLLKERFNYHIIPEVNYLFERPSSASSTWYFERQVERWQLADSQSKKGNNVILDGDPMQPLWYNWIFSDSSFQPLQQVFDFYLDAIQKGEIKFPDKYFVLSASDAELRKRKEGDASRSRKNFEAHLKLITPQLEYFSQMNSQSRGHVDVIQTKEVSNTTAYIAQNLPEPNVEIDQIWLLNHQIQFMKASQ